MAWSVTVDLLCSVASNLLVYRPWYHVVKLLAGVPVVELKMFCLSSIVACNSNMVSSRRIRRRLMVSDFGLILGMYLSSLRIVLISRVYLHIYLYYSFLWLALMRSRLSSFTVYRQIDKQTGGPSVPCNAGSRWKRRIKMSYIASRHLDARREYVILHCMLRVERCVKKTRMHAAIKNTFYLEEAKHQREVVDEGRRCASRCLMPHVPHHYTQRMPRRA